MRLAKINNLIVETIIIGESADYPTYTNVSNIQCGIGWTDNQDGTFTDNQPPTTPFKMVGISAMGELLPSAVRTEIKTIALDDLQPVPKREAASRIITRMHSDDQIDSLGAELSTLLSQLVTHTALTQPESDAILAALQA